MVIVFAFLALLSGLATILLLGVLSSVLLKRLAPGWIAEDGRPSPVAVLVQLGLSAVTAAAGGYVTSMTARGNPLVYVLGLAIALLALSALNALENRGRQPIWFQLAQVAIAPLGVVSGALLRLKVAGIL